MKRMMTMLFVVLMFFTVTMLGITTVFARDIGLGIVNSEGDYYYIVEKGKAAIIGRTGLVSSEVTIPSTLGGYLVTSIEGGFWGCNEIKKVTIGNNITSIGENAFYECENLTNVTIGSSVISIGDRAFGGCRSLTSLTIGNSVTSIGDSAFEDCKSLTSLTIDNSVINIGSGAFYGCNLKSVYITDLAAWCNSAGYGGLLSNGTGLYLNNQPVQNLVIPDDVTSIRAWTFRGCTSLTSVTIPDSVTSIEGAAFQSCSNLTSVTIPNSVTIIDSMAFYDCSGLTSVTIPNSVTYIGSTAFSRCTGLIKVTIGDGITEIEENTFGGCKSLTSIIIGNNVTTINKNAFADCLAIKNVYLKSPLVALRLVDENAFGGLAKVAETIYVKEDIIGVGDMITSMPYKAEGIVVDGVTYTAYSMSPLPTMSPQETITSETDGQTIPFEQPDKDTTVVFAAILGAIGGVMATIGFMFVITLIKKNK